MSLRNIPHNAPPALETLLSALQNLQTDANGWNARCPCHDDGKNSLGISVGDSGKVLVKCLAGCPTPQIVYECGVKMSDLFPERSGSKRNDKGTIKATYDYYKPNGEFAFQVVRMEPKNFLQRRKTPSGEWAWSLAEGYYRRRGNREWGRIKSGVEPQKSDVHLPKVEKELYRLPELLASDKDEFVFVVEGEKDVDRLRALGLTATCNPGGADANGNKWLNKFNGFFRGRHVVLIPDNDPHARKQDGDFQYHKDGRPVRPGQDHMAYVAKSLKPLAATVRYLELPGLPSKGDVSDWLDAGGTKEQLLALAAGVVPGVIPGFAPGEPAAPTTKKETPAADDPAATHIELKITNDIDLDVLGYVEGGKVKVWSRFHRKTEIIDVDRLTYASLLRLCGPIAKAKVASGKEPAEGEHTVNQVKSAVALLSGYRKITDETEVGIGCWEGLDSDGHPTPAVVLVGSREAAILNGEPNFKRVTTPQYGGRTMDLSAESPWFSYERLYSLMGGYSREWAVGVVQELQTLFSKWIWSNQSVAPQVMTGCVLASFVQTLWKWRPQIAVIGESNSGKSTLFEFLAGSMNSLGVFGRLVIKSDQSSSAGLRQHLSRSAPIPVCDEFDNTKERREIMEMIRSASRGGTLLKGTAGKQRGVSFVLRHIFWLGGITIEMQRAPDANRFIIAELLPPAESSRGVLVLPSSTELQELGEKLLVIAVKNIFRAREIAEQLRAERIEGINRRVIESYSVPAAMLAAIYEVGAADAVRLLGMMVEDTRGSQQDEKDQDILMSDLLAAKLYAAGGRQFTVAQILNDNHSDEHRDVLAAHGVGVVFDSCGRRNLVSSSSQKLLFVSHRIAGRLLLRGTTWEGQAIHQVLARIPGALLGRRRLGGSHQRGVTIPWEYLESFGLNKYDPHSDEPAPEGGGF